MPSRGTTRTSFACAAVIGLLLAVTPIVSAHTTRTSSEHTLKFKRVGTIERFNGKIVSNSAACERGRKAKLFKVRAGAKPDTLVATNTSNTDGKWKEELTGLEEFPAGKYYSVATKKVIERKGHKHVCKPSKTETLKIETATDTDEDGWPDSQDCAPEFANPPEATECYAPTDPYSINTGSIVPGQKVWLSDLHITAISEDDSQMWAQLVDGDPGYQGPEYSGLAIDLGDQGSGDLEPGDKILMLAEVTEVGVTAEDITVQSVGGPVPAAHPVTTAAFVANSTPLDDVLIRLGPVKLVEHTAFGWILSDDIVVGLEASSDLPIRNDGSWFSGITGIGVAGTTAGILPRGPADVTDSPVMNETDDGTEADFCNTQFPTTWTTTVGGEPFDVFGRLFEAGTTEEEGADPDVIAQLAYGLSGGDPRTATDWWFVDAQYNGASGLDDDDEYLATLALPGVGEFNYVFRFSLDGGATFTYCDVDGAGSNPDSSFDTTQMGTLTVTPAGG